MIGLAEIIARLQAVATKPYEVNRARKFELPATFFKVCQTIDMYLSFMRSEIEFFFNFETKIVLEKYMSFKPLTMLRRVNRNIETNILIILIELSKAP